MYLHKKSAPSKFQFQSIQKIIKLSTKFVTKQQPGLLGQLFWILEALLAPKGGSQPKKFSTFTHHSNMQNTSIYSQLQTNRINEA